MPTLFVKTGCPFCKKVLDAEEELGIELNERNIADVENTEELIARGGKVQVPYLVDEERGVSMYESDDIVAYLHKVFGKEQVS